MGEAWPFEGGWDLPGNNTTTTTNNNTTTDNSNNNNNNHNNTTTDNDSNDSNNSNNSNNNHKGWEYSTILYKKSMYTMQLLYIYNSILYIYQY